MEPKTQVIARENEQEIFITREFDLPVQMLFKAYTEPVLIEQWMGTRVIKMDCSPHGFYQFETSNAEGKVVFSANGTIHHIISNEKIIRTFEMETMSFGVQLEFLEFERLSDNTCRLQIQSIYKSVALRDENLKLPFVQGINMAHNRLQKIFN
ncbi:SRPBCC family protein [Pseudopedobacter beijingensis]|uniref:SRPBCC domain-containing protein n=1 Tax=Pseudopedobacter beijingensis TaxID=1207056 RepID=A0ABW4IBC0_9SPHI